MRNGKFRIALTACTAVLALSVLPLHAQVASAIVREGETLTQNTINYNVSSIGSPDINGIGGWAVQLNVSDPNSNSLSSAWGTVDGVTMPAFFRFEGTFDNVEQTSWESSIGFDNAGQVFYSASGSDVTDPNNTFSIDSVFLDDVATAVRGRDLPAPLDTFKWAFCSGPNLTHNGVAYFVGGFNTDGGSSADNRGLFDGNGQAFFIGGDLLPGLPDVIDGSTFDFDVRFSNLANHYILPVTVDNLSSTADNAVVVDGAGLYIDGGLVIEGSPVPASVGGMVDENWDNFDYFQINEMGEHIFTGDTDGDFNTDEFVYVSHSGIVMREADVEIGGLVVDGSIENASMNDNGDWAVIWDVDDPIAGEVEALIFNGEAILIEDVDDVDWDGDSIADPGFRIGGLGFGGTRSLRVTNRDPNGVVKIYCTADVEDNGASALEAMLCMPVTVPAGPTGDLEISVSDTPDPVVALPGQIKYIVAARNNGDGPLTGVTVTTTLDGNLVFNSGDPIAVHDGSPTGGTVTAAIGALAPYELRVYEFICDVNTPGGVTSTTVATANESDPVPANNNATNDTDTGAVADMRVDALTDTPDPLNDPNGVFTYDITVANGGLSDATGVVATLTLDPNLVFVSSDLGTHDGSPTGGVVTANIGGMLSQDVVAWNVVAEPTMQGTFTVTADVTANQPDPDLANNMLSEDSTFSIEADVVVSIEDAPDPVTPVGGQLTYSVTVENTGPSPAFATDVVLTLDDDTSFVSTTLGSHDGSPTGGQVTASIGTLADGGTATFDVVVDTLAAGRIAVQGVATTSSTDPVAENNNGATFTLVLNGVAGLPVGVYSDIDGHPTKDVPGIAGAGFSSFSQPFLNLSTEQWIIEATTDLGDEIIVLGDLCGGTVMVQEGVTVIDPNAAETVGSIDSTLSINDNGDFTFATNTDGPTSADEVLVKYDATTGMFEVIAREGDLAAPVASTYGFSIEDGGLLNSGQVWFIADTNLASDFDEVAFSKNGNVVLAQEGTDVPTGQIGSEAWDNFDFGDLSVDAAGLNWAMQGDLEGDLNFDDVFVVNGQVVVQEAVALPGFALPADTVEYGYMFPNGDWMARGDNEEADGGTLGQDWVLHNGTVIAKTGDPVHAGALETYSDAPFSSTFFEFTLNNHGDVIVAGTTNALEDASNAVLVLNNELVVAREDDPIDLDGNGLLDDGVRVRTFGNDDAILTDDFQLYVTCTMRAFDDDGSNTDIGDAYIRYNLCGIARPCGDINGDFSVDATDYQAFVVAFSSTPCDDNYAVCADLDGDGIVSFLDYQQWLVCYEDFNGFKFRQGGKKKENPGIDKVDQPGNPGAVQPRGAVRPGSALQPR